MSFINQKEYTFVLGCPRSDAYVAILCRSNGPNPGPAFCDSKKNAIKLKTRLSNDPRGLGNHRAMEIIKNLLIYRIDDDTEPVWKDGDLWAYLPLEKVKCVESAFWG